MKLGALSKTVIHRVGHSNKKDAPKKGPEMGSVYAQIEAMNDVYARCHEKTDVQVCTLMILL